MFDLNEVPHRRYNPLSDEWLLVSPQRTRRPWQGQTEAPPPVQLSSYDPHCYLCPGNVRAGGVQNPHYQQTFVFPNDFAALLPAPRVADFVDGANDAGRPALLQARSARGHCRVICYSPRHDLSLATLQLPALYAVVETWIEQTQELAADPAVQYVQIFENRGAMMGASNPHPHGQIWAGDDLPVLLAREQASQARHFARYGRTLLGDYLETELERQERIIVADEHFVALVPFWAVWPFEALLISRRPLPDLPALLPVERQALAAVLRRLTAAYDLLFQVAFPYSMGFHQQPYDGQAHPEWHLHAHFYPPLLRSASVRKFMVGYEMLAEAQRDITAEQAAARLRTLVATV